MIDAAQIEGIGLAVGKALVAQANLYDARLAALEARLATAEARHAVLDTRIAILERMIGAPAASATTQPTPSLN